MSLHTASLRGHRGLLLAALVSLGGFLFCAAEIVLSARGATLCHTESCRLVEGFSLLSRPLMAGLAAVFFLLQGLGTVLVRRGASRLVGPLAGIASAGLGAETVFVLRQFLDYHLHCPFCLIVAGCVFLSSGATLLSLGRASVLTVVLGVALAMLLTPLSVTPLREAATGHIKRGDPQETCFLIYSDECPHCHEVLSFCRDLEDLDLYLCPKEKAMAFLRAMDLSGVPVMVVDRRGEKIVLVGSGPILSHLRRGEADLGDLLAPSGICEEDRKCEPAGLFDGL